MTDELFESIYKNLDDPSSFASAKLLYDAAKAKDASVTLNQVKKWLSSQDTYTLHRQTYRKFKQNKIYVFDIDHQWEMDLADMTPLKNFNDGFKFILTCIDVLSKYAWARPLMNKSGTSISNAFTSILSQGRRPWRLRTDKGKEFLNHNFQNLLKKQDIHFFTSQNEDIKCAVVERFNRTLKNRMYRYFTEKGTYKWTDVLDKLLNNYNNTVHRSIKMKPAEVNVNNVQLVLDTLYGSVQRQKEPKFQVGDYVRISKYRQVFDKSYKPQFTEEIFKISKVINHPTEPLYKLVDLSGEDIVGTFYERELLKIEYNENRAYKIEKVLKKRRLKNGRIQLLVKWFGYPEKFNEWVLETDLE